MQEKRPIKLLGYICKKCGWKWIPRGEEYPRCCPNTKCHVVTWDIPREKAKRVRV